MKDFIEKYGMALRIMRAYILSTYKAQQRAEIFKEIQAYFDVKNNSHKFNSEK